MGKAYTVRVTLPAVHVAVFREQIRDWLSSDMECGPLSTQTFDEWVDEMRAHRAALDLFGWGATDPEVDIEWEGDLVYVAAMFEKVMGHVSDEIAEAVGEYRKEEEPIDPTAVGNAAKALDWLVHTWDGLPRHRVEPVAA